MKKDVEKRLKSLGVSLKGWWLYAAKMPDGKRCVGVTDGPYMMYRRGKLPAIRWTGHLYYEAVCSTVDECVVSLSEQMKGAQ